MFQFSILTLGGTRILVYGEQVFFLRVAKPLGCDRGHSHPLSIRGAKLPRLNINRNTQNVG